jgi:hypothetical protein
MPGFDRGWFDELRNLDSARVQRLPKDAFVPHLHEARLAGVISSAFAQTANDLLKRLYGTRYRFDRDYCVYERHICVFPQGRACRGQWNIGFSAGTSHADDFARIGLGFRLRNDFPDGIDDFKLFLQKVLPRPQAFDSTFGTLGGYAEGLPSGTRLSAAAIRNDNPDLDEDWRFYGKRVNDAKILGSVDRFAGTAVKVFDTIRAGGFF